MNSIDDLVLHLGASVTKRLKTMGDGLQPVSQEQVDAIRESVTLELVTRLRSIESARDAALRRAAKLEGAQELSTAYRKDLS